MRRRDANTIIDRARAEVEGLRRRFEQMRWRMRDIRLLFFDGPRPSEPALRWLDRLAADNFVFSSAYHDDAREAARREGRRELALEIIASVKLDPARLEKLSQQLQEAEDYD
jgi:hypothetical protein